MIPVDQIKNLAFTLQYPPKRCVLRSSVVIATSGTPIVINHNLNYVPYVRCFYENPVGTLQRCGNSPQSAVQFIIEPRTTTLVITGITNDVTAVGKRVYYHIYAR